MDIQDIMKDEWELMQLERHTDKENEVRFYCLFYQIIFILYIYVSIF